MQYNSIYQNSRPTTNFSLIAAATIWQSAGYQIIPIKPGTKIPKVKWREPKVYSQAELRHYFANGSLALAGGINNVVCLDFDLKNIPDNPLGWMSEIEKLIPAAIMKKIYVQMTPSTGFHWLFLTPTVETCRKLCRDENGLTLVEIKAMGGYFLINPSQAYKLMLGRPGELQVLTLDEFFLILEVLKKFDRYKPPEPKPFVLPCSTSSSDSLAAKFNAQADHIPLIRYFGFEVSSHSGDKTFFKHPDSKSKNCANWHATQRKLYVFSTSIGLLEADKAYTPFDLMVIIKQSKSEAYKEIKFLLGVNHV